MDIEQLISRLRNKRPMGTPQNVMIDCHEAADAIESLNRDNFILRAERDQSRAQRDFCVKMLTRIHSFISPKDVTLPDGRRFEFNNPAIEHDMLKALSEAIRAVPDELKKAESALPEDEWHAHRHPTSL